MVAAYDAVGPSATCQVSTVKTAFTWTHTPVGTPTNIIVCLTVGLSGAATGALGSFASVSYGGQAMSLLGSSASGNSTWGGIFFYGLSSGISAGPQTVSVGAYTSPGTSTFNQTIGASVSFTAGAGFGTFQSANGSSTALSLAIPGTVTGGLCFTGFCSGTGIGTVTSPSVERLKQNHDNSSTGNMAGATNTSLSGSTTLSYPSTADFWSAVGIEILPSGAGPASILPQQAKHRAPGLYTRLTSAERNATYSR